VNSVGERRLYRARLHRASRPAPKGHLEARPGRGDSRTRAEKAPTSRSTVWAINREGGRFPRGPRSLQIRARRSRAPPPSFGRRQPRPIPRCAKPRWRRVPRLRQAPSPATCERFLPLHLKISEASRTAAPSTQGLAAGRVEAAPPRVRDRQGTGGPNERDQGVGRSRRSNCRAYAPVRPGEGRGPSAPPLITEHYRKTW
jgi:hypothetical protein